MGIYPTFENGTRIGLDNVWRIDVDVKAKNESSIGGFQFSWCWATPSNVFGWPWRARSRVTTCEVSFGRPVGYGRCFRSRFWGNAESIIWSALSIRMKFTRLWLWRRTRAGRRTILPLCGWIRALGPPNTLNMKPLGTCTEINIERNILYIFTVDFTRCEFRDRIPRWRMWCCVCVSTKFHSRMRTVAKSSEPVELRFEKDYRL